MGERLKAYIGPGGDPEAGSLPWDGHIEDERFGMLDRYAGSLPEVVAWARARTDWVLILQGGDQGHLWAGSAPRPDDVHEDYDGGNL